MCKNVSDYKGCTANDIVTVNNPDSISFNFSLSNYNGNNISCFGFNDGMLIHINLAVPIDFSTIIWTDSIGNLFLHLIF